MIRSKGEAGTGNVVEATRHMRQIRADIRRLSTLDETELFAAAKELRAPYDLVKEVAATGKLPVVLFTAGGIATPADAAMMMQLGAEGVFVGSGIFKSGDPAQARRRDRQGDHVLRRPGDDRQGVARARRGDGRHQRRDAARRRAPGRPVAGEPLRRRGARAAGRRARARRALAACGASAGAGPAPRRARRASTGS